MQNTAKPGLLKWNIRSYFIFFFASGRKAYITKLYSNQVFCVELPCFFSGQKYVDLILNNNYYGTNTRNKKNPSQVQGKRSVRAGHLAFKKSGKIYRRH